MSAQVRGLEFPVPDTPVSRTASRPPAYDQTATGSSAATATRNRADAAHIGMTMRWARRLKGSGEHIGLLCAEANVIIKNQESAPNGGSRATTVASDDHAARPPFQSVREPSAEYLRLTLGVLRLGTCTQMFQFCMASSSGGRCVSHSRSVCLLPHTSRQESSSSPKLSSQKSASLISIRSRPTASVMTSVSAIPADSSSLATARISVSVNGRTSEEYLWRRLLTIWKAGLNLRPIATLCARWLRCSLTALQRVSTVLIASRSTSDISWCASARALDCSISQCAALPAGHYSGVLESAGRGNFSFAWGAPARELRPSASRSTSSRRSASGFSLAFR